LCCSLNILVELPDRENSENDVNNRQQTIHVTCDAEKIKSVKSLYNSIRILFKKSVHLENQVDLKYAE